MQRTRQHECGFPVHIGQGSVRGHAQRTDRAWVSGVVTAHCRLGRLAVVMRGPNPDGDAWQPRDRLDHADELRRPERAAELVEARSKIRDPDCRALTVAQLGRDYRRIAHVLRLDLDTSVENDVRETLLFLSRQQPAKDRIAVETWKAPPHDPRRGGHERSRTPIADHGDIQSIVSHGLLAPAPSTTR